MYGEDPDAENAPAGTRGSAATLPEHGESWILDSTNWQQAQGLLPPVVLDRVKRGDYWYKVLPVERERFRANYSTKFWEASADNAGKYDVDPETCGLKDIETGKVPDFYFGYPFPTIDPKEPLAACKMAWNFDAANSMGEGQGATFTLNGIDGSGEFKRIKLWLHTNAYLGRHGGPIDNPEHLRATSLSTVLDPHDVDGVGGLAKRTNDWDSQDEIWFYVPADAAVCAASTRPLAPTRSAASTSSPTISTATAARSSTTSGSSSVSRPSSPRAEPGTASAAEDQLADPLRGGHPLLQGAPTKPRARRAHRGWSSTTWCWSRARCGCSRAASSDPYYNFGKVIMYMDKDLYRIYWKLVHNRAGEYFYNAMCAYHFSKSADGTFSAVTPNLVVGVNDKTEPRLSGWALHARSSSSATIPDDYFSLRTLTHLSE